MITLDKTPDMGVDLDTISGVLIELEATVDRRRFVATARLAQVAVGYLGVVTADDQVMTENALAVLYHLDQAEDIVTKTDAWAFDAVVHIAQAVERVRHMRTRVMHREQERIAAEAERKLTPEERAFLADDSYPRAPGDLKIEYMRNRLGDETMAEFWRRTRPVLTCIPKGCRGDAL